MAKKVKVSECCVITTDDKGQRTLVGKAKEALTTLEKKGIDVYILLEGTKKDDAEKFLNENNVPFKALLETDDTKTKFDAVVLGEGNIVLLRGDWEWSLNQLVDKLYDNGEKPEHKSEQQKMDEKFDQYKHWADEANKMRAKQKSDAQSAD